MAKILEAYVKNENNNTKNSATFSKYVKNIPIKNDDIVTLFDVTFLHTNIPVIDTLQSDPQEVFCKKGCS